MGIIVNLSNLFQCPVTFLSDKNYCHDIKGSCRILLFLQRTVESIYNKRHPPSKRDIGFHFADGNFLTISYY